MKPNQNYTHHPQTDLEPNGCPFDSKPIRKWQIQSDFSPIQKYLEKIPLRAHTEQWIQVSLRIMSYVAAFTILPRNQAENLGLRNKRKIANTAKLIPLILKETETRFATCMPIPRENWLTKLI